MLLKMQLMIMQIIKNYTVHTLSTDSIRYHRTTTGTQKIIVSYSIVILLII